MRIIDCVQGTPEWLACRAGIPSASSFDMIITTKGEPSKQRTKYMYRLAGERISGVVEESYQNGAMQRGKEMEDEARQLYSLQTGLEIVQVGFCVTEGKAICGASPDGMVNEDGSIEIKCPSMAVHVGYLIDNVLPTDYIQQVQGQLFVTERLWVDFVSYYPGLKPLIVRVEPDKKFQAALKSELEKFCVELDAITERIR